MMGWHKIALLAAVLPSTAVAADGQIEFGLYGGVNVMDPLEVLDTSYVVLPRFGYYFTDQLALEGDFGIQPGMTRDGIPDPYPYLSFTPRVHIVGRMFNDEDRAVNMLLSIGMGAWLKKVNDNGDLGLPTGEKLDADFLGSAGPGLLFPIADGMVNLRTDLRFMLSAGGAENYQNRGDSFLSWEWTAGVNFILGGPRDADKDGIVDDEDSCLDQAEDMDEFEDEDGCPEPDNDLDSILDTDDDCPNEAEDVDGFADEDGCPEADNDEDGVLDGDDACPTEAGTAATEGCPDTDGDGLADQDEECPDEAGPEASYGCPDSDEDGVPDHRDECPEEKAPEGANTLRSNGCPTVAFIADGALVITDKVEFDSGKSTIKSASHALLDTVAGLLETYVGLKKVQVQGHTDSDGNDDSNMKLSQERTEAVVEYLVGQGIDPSRLEAKGFGESEPLVENDSRENKAKNRRVEFKILTQDAPKRVKRKMKEAAKKANEKAESEAAAPEAAAPETAEE
jgi:outer membrane protein OmpA-like peptidoglycan-associated protein